MSSPVNPGCPHLMLFVLMSLIGAVQRTPSTINIEELSRNMAVFANTEITGTPGLLHGF